MKLIWTVINFLNHAVIKWMALALGGLILIYFTILDIWAEEWFVKNFVATHKTIFFWLVAINVCWFLLSSIKQLIEGKKESRYSTILENMILCFKFIVESKLHRFREKFRDLGSKDNIFKVITQPKDQIQMIAEQARVFLSSAYVIKKENIDITIAHSIDGHEGWHFDFKANNSWKHLSAEELFRSASALKHCFESGEEVLLLDKELAAKQGKYLISERDTRLGNGSVYCYPAFIERRDFKTSYIISIVTYGKLLCSENNKGEAEVAKLLMREFCKRIELELALSSIKEWVELGKSNGKVEVYVKKAATRK